ncbi:MAG: FkbM family methyltransferase [Planctomycetes bacterium]|nr:FkbM family methyltransferase [Planctomycetota bacterium]
MISYATNREDVVLARAFGLRPSGFYIDVGGALPTFDTNTYHFYRSGWNGLVVEPNPGLVALFATQRPRDRVVNAAVSDQPGELRFFEVAESVGESTLSAEIAERHRRKGRTVTEHVVLRRTLADLCEEHVGDRSIDFLSIDVEGHEREVLLGADFRRWRPLVLVIEATEPGTAIPSHAGWEDLVLAAGYRHTLFDGVNRFYVRDESSELIPALSYPATRLDGATDARVADLMASLDQFRGADGRLVGRTAAWTARQVQKAVNLTRSILGPVAGHGKSRS